ncbi:hypothetical protein KKF59_01140 [Patescibacteria group bacterium]|nr:hypothetical protein [Patescibacteria group bacterium]
MDSATNISGWIAMFLQFACVLLAYPDQIRCLKKAENSNAISVFKWWIIVPTHIAWFVWSIITKNYFVLAPNIPGLFFSIVILKLIYQKRTAKIS